MIFLVCSGRSYSNFLANAVAWSKRWARSWRSCTWTASARSASAFAAAAPRSRMPPKRATLPGYLVGLIVIQGCTWRSGPRMTGV